MLDNRNGKGEENKMQELKFRGTCILILLFFNFIIHRCNKTSQGMVGFLVTVSEAAGISGIVQVAAWLCS